MYLDDKTYFLLRNKLDHVFSHIKHDSNVNIFEINYNDKILTLFITEKDGNAYNQIKGLLSHHDFSKLKNPYETNIT